ncbi:type II secretion system protein F (GspF) [Paenibacillaceae bacterium GAS479]|nr:type II secretion system protein F (GspF) [Paenibacillaceae bacterium GAS479]
MGLVLASAVMGLIWLALVSASSGWKAVLRELVSAGSTSGRRKFGRRLGAEAIVLLLETRGMPQVLDDRLATLHALMRPLKGEQWTVRDTRLFAASATGYGYLAAAAGLLLAGAAGEPNIAWLGFVCGLLLTIGRLREVHKQARRRKQELLLALPDLLGKLTLLIGAGETVHRALAHCADRPPGHGRESLLHGELVKAVQAMSNGQSFSAAIEAFSRRCAVQEVSVFTTVLLLNYRRGGDQLSLSLREISLPLWDKRRSAARTRGEEASSKLVFPLTGIFFILMVLVGAPAMLLMNG